MKQIKRTKLAPGEVRASDSWRTPLPLFAALDDEFGFNVDLAADANNHLCPTWLGPGGEAEDALAVRQWARHGDVGFLNMPYSSDLILRFMAAVARNRIEMTIVALHPHDTSAAWWSYTRHAVEIREMPHRVPYLRSDGITKAGAMFASAVSIYRPQPGILLAHPRRVLWSWKTRAALEKAERKNAMRLNRLDTLRGDDDAR